MKPSIETDFDCLMLTPSLAIVHVDCGGCDEYHGWTIQIGWIFWNFVLFFPADPDLS